MHVIIKRLIDASLYNIDKNKCSPWLKRKIDDDLREDIIKATSNFINIPLNVRIFCLVNDIKEPPKCIECGNHTSFFHNRFLDFCSNECASKSNITKSKVRNTNIEKFGVVCNLSIISKETRKANAKKACETKKEILQDIYGVDNVMHIPEVAAKHKISVKNAQSKRIATVKEKGHHAQKHITNATYINDIEYIKNNFIIDNEFLFDDFMSHFNICFSNAHKLKHKLGLEGTPNKKSGCKHKQKEIIDWLYSVYDGVIHVETRSIIPPLELDIYIPEHKLAIEFNGLMWHSYGKSEYSMFNNYAEEDRNKHLNKTQMCAEKEIQLLHIFENEWQDNKELWKSVILSKCKMTKKLYARNCSMKEIDNSTYRAFVTDNHLQGYAAASIRYGLYHDNELVALMSFAKNRFSEKGTHELIRFSSKVQYTIIGGFTKLLTNFKRQYPGSSIISYANLRWSIGNVYEKSGFKLLNQSKPNYWYIDSNMKLHSRLKFQRHKLDDVGSESEIMFNRGYRRIWDCGNAVYMLNNN